MKPGTFTQLPYLVRLSTAAGGILGSVAFCAFGLCGLWQFGWKPDALYLALTCGGIMFAIIFTFILAIGLLCARHNAQSREKQAHFRSE